MVAAVLYAMLTPEIGSVYLRTIQGLLGSGLRAILIACKHCTQVAADRKLICPLICPRTCKNLR
jgi:hypothetical protein